MLILRRTKGDTPTSKNQEGRDSYLFASHDLEGNYDSKDFGTNLWLIDVKKVEICTEAGWVIAKTSKEASKCMGSYCTFEPIDVVDYTKLN